MLLVDDILLLPWKGLMGIFKEIQKYAEREMNDRDRLRERLLEAQVLFEMDQITEEEYLKREQEIMAQLNVAEGEDASIGTDEVSDVPMISGKERALKSHRKT